MEHNVLSAACKSRQAFEELESLGVAEFLSDKGRLVYNGIQEFYGADSSVDHVDREMLGNRLERKYPKHAQVFHTIVTNLDPSVSTTNIALEIVAFKKAALKEKLMAALLGGQEGFITSLLKEWEQLDHANGPEAPSVFNSVGLDELLTRMEEEERLAVAPVDLANSLKGGPLRGHNIIIYARPDVGKTAAGLTVAASALRQGRRVLYCGNEDPMEDIVARLISNLTNIPLDKLKLDPGKVMDVANNRGYQQFFFAEMYPGTVQEVENYIKKIEPEVLIVDQMRNLESDDNNRVLQLDSVARNLRNLGKKYNLFNFSLTQAGDSADNKLYLEMGDVDFSNTGVPGAADCMIGIGANREFLANGHRMLSFPKNKIGHTKEPIRVTLDYTRSKLV